MVLKAAFIFVAPGADPAVHKSKIVTQDVELTTVGVASYRMAEGVVRSLVAEGVEAIELCGGFGTEGTAIVKKAAGKSAIVGVVRFDHHPGLMNQSGDDLF